MQVSVSVGDGITGWISRGDKTNTSIRERNEVVCVPADVSVSRGGVLHQPFFHITFLSFILPLTVCVDFACIPTSVC